MGYPYNPRVGDNYRYEKDSSKPFKVSRTKIELFYNCPTCFYKDARLGLRLPPSPSWAINSAVDSLLKKEMDFCRKENRPHGIFTENGLDIKPFHHPDIEKWQNAFHGIQYLDEKHNFLLYGGVDDIMVDEKDQLVVIDFKATAKTSEIVNPSDVYDNGEGYKRQLEIYSWLLQQNGFPVSELGYLLYYNGDAGQPHLGTKMVFRRSLVSFNLDTSWINPLIAEMYHCLQQEEIPSYNAECHQCIYLDAVERLDF
jgi:hypothetical protein